MAVFRMHARGPLFEEFSEKLQAECNKHWRAGRQMCEVLSLTGHPCTNPIHRGGSEGAGGGEQIEPRDDDRHAFLIYKIITINFLYIIFYDWFYQALFSLTVNYPLENIAVELDTCVLVTAVELKAREKIPSS